MHTDVHACDWWVKENIQTQSLFTLLFVVVVKEFFLLSEAFAWTVRTRKKEGRQQHKITRKQVTSGVTSEVVLGLSHGFLAFVFRLQLVEII